MNHQKIEKLGKKRGSTLISFKNKLKGQNVIRESSLKDI